MKRLLWTLATIAAMAGGELSAHHSYAAYDRERLVEIEGVIAEFKVVSPHSLLKVRADEGQFYTGEWLAAGALKHRGVEPDTLKSGDKVILKGNPRRDFSDSGILNLKGVQRPSDGWSWP
jgi:hypothetical protein